MAPREAGFATAINCMDGRTQNPVIEWMRKHYGVSYVDMITEPGVDAILAENRDIRTIESIKRKVGISIEKHGSKFIVVVGHYDCAGDPVDMNTHLAQIRSAIETVASWGFRAQVFGVWIGDHWNVDSEIHL
jgi:carbonic anhydrase